MNEVEEKMSANKSRGMWRDIGYVWKFNECIRASGPIQFDLNVRARWLNRPANRYK